MNKTILVTGGAGYVGSRTLVELLKNKGHNVVVLDQLTDEGFDGRFENLEGVAAITGVKLGSDRFQYYDGSVGDKELLEQILAKHDTDSCIDFAAFIEAGTSMDIPEIYFDNNVVNFYTLAKTLFEHERGVDRIIKSSTAAIYGDLDPGEHGLLEYWVNISRKETGRKGKAGLGKAEKTRQGEKEGEDLHDYLMERAEENFKNDTEFWNFLNNSTSQIRLRQPTNVYGWTKVMNELTLEYFANKHEKEHVIFRYFNAYGVYSDSSSGTLRPRLKETHAKETHLIPIAGNAIQNYSKKQDKGSRTLKKGEFMYMFGGGFDGFEKDYEPEDGSNIRDYVHIDDLARAHVEGLNVKSGVYNLATGEGISTKRMLELTADSFNAELVWVEKKYRNKEYRITEQGDLEFTDSNYLSNLPEKALIVVEDEPREGDSPILYADPGKAKDTFDFETKVKLKDGHNEALRQVVLSRG